MKKFISIMLAFVMVLSLCACGSKDDEKPDESVEPTSSSEPVSSNEPEKGSTKLPDRDKTPDQSEEPSDNGHYEELDEHIRGNGFGVDGISSLWMSIDFGVKDDGRRKVISCHYEADEHWDLFMAEHELIDDEIAQMDYEFAINLDDDEVWQKRDGVWEQAKVEGYEFPWRQLWTTPLSETVTSIEVEDDSTIYVVLNGKCKADVFNNLFSFAYEDAEKATGRVDVQLFYEADTGELSSIEFNDEEHGYFIEAFVYDYNDTDVYVSFETADEFDHCADDEDYIADVTFLSFVVDDDDIKEYLGDKGSWMNDDELFALSYYINYYSEEGFLRSLRGAEYSDEDERTAAVVLCNILSIDYSELWTNHFMTKGEAEAVIAKMGG